LKPCLLKPKEEISTSSSALDSLVVEVLEFCPFSSNFVRLALVEVYPSVPFAGLVSSSSFNHSSHGYSVTVGRSEPKILFNTEPVGSTRFSPLQLLQRRKILEKFSCIFVLVLVMKEPDREQFTCTNEISHCSSLYT